MATVAMSPAVLQHASHLLPPWTADPFSHTFRTYGLRIFFIRAISLIMSCGAQQEHHLSKCWLLQHIVLLPISSVHIECAALPLLGHLASHICPAQRPSLPRQP